MVQALGDRQHRHDAQEHHQPAGPARLVGLGLVGMDRFQTADRIVWDGVLIGHVLANTRWRLPFAAAERREVTGNLLAETSASDAGRERGALSLSTITARTPS